jgi:hypothetical protein
MVNRRTLIKAAALLGVVSESKSFALVRRALADEPANARVDRSVSVLEFLSANEIAQVERHGVALDLSASIEKAVKTNKPLDWPAGTYACNITLPRKIRMTGTGPNQTIIRPFNTIAAAITYAERGTDWTFDSVFEGIGFYGTEKTGVGFTFSKTDPARYITGDEYSGRATFRNCYFEGLEKGIQAPFGNIGIYVNECGFGGNKYGFYSINNKFGGFMHAGNKYFRGGEFHSNDCAVYVHNTQDGFGAIEFDGTVFEGNAIAGYFYHNAPPMISPISLRNYWSEANGSRFGPKSVTIDAWWGRTNGKQTLAARTWILDGNSVHAEFEQGFFSDCCLKATDSIVVSTHDRFESEPGYGGAPCSVDDPATSRIIVRDMICDSGGAQVPGIIAEGTITQARHNINSSGGGAAGRANLLRARALVTSLPGLTGKSVHFEARQDLSGSISVEGKVVRDGLLYGVCNEYSLTLMEGQSAGCTSTSTTLVVGWWVCTVDVKVILGIPSFKVWDRSTNQMAAWTGFADSHWHTWGGIGLLSSGTPTVFLDVVSTNRVMATFRASSFQMKRFASQAEAQDFLQAQVYAA